MLLTLNNYKVIVAYDGSEAVQKVFEKPDLILLDVNMPQMDGFAVCSQIRDYVNCPIIFLTARMEDADKIKGFSVGGDDYMLKPFSMDELGARIVTCQGKIIDFAKKEFDIIELLSIHAGQLFDKEHIRRIHMKIKKVSQEEHIDTVWVLGIDGKNK